MPALWGLTLPNAASFVVRDSGCPESPEEEPGPKGEGQEGFPVVAGVGSIQAELREDGRTDRHPVALRDPIPCLLSPDALGHSFPFQLRCMGGRGHGVGQWALGVQR